MANQPNNDPANTEGCQQELGPYDFQDFHACRLVEKKDR